MTKDNAAILFDFMGWCFNELSEDVGGDGLANDIMRELATLADEPWKDLISNKD